MPRQRQRGLEAFLELADVAGPIVKEDRPGGSSLESNLATDRSSPKEGGNDQAQILAALPKRRQGDAEAGDPPKQVLSQHLTRDQPLQILRSEERRVGKEC